MADWIDIFKDKLRMERPSVPNDDWEVMSRLLDRHIRRKSMVKWSLGAIPLAAAVLAIMFLAHKDGTETSTPPERLVAETHIAEALAPEAGLADTNISETNTAEPTVEDSSAPGHPETASIADEEVVETYEPSVYTPRVASEEHESPKHSEPIEPVAVEDNDQWWLETKESHPNDPAICVQVLRELFLYHPLCYLRCRRIHPRRPDLLGHQAPDRHQGLRQPPARSWRHPGPLRLHHDRRPACRGPSAHHPLCRQVIRSGAQPAP